MKKLIIISILLLVGGCGFRQEKDTLQTLEFYFRCAPTSTTNIEVTISQNQFYMWSGQQNKYMFMVLTDFMIYFSLFSPEILAHH